MFVLVLLKTLAHRQGCKYDPLGNIGVYEGAFGTPFKERGSWRGQGYLHKKGGVPERSGSLELQTG